MTHETQTTPKTCHEAWLEFAQNEYDPDRIFNEYNRAFLAGWEAAIDYAESKS